MSSTLHAAIAAFNSAVDRWCNWRFTIALREATDAKIYGYDPRTDCYHHVPDGYGKEWLAMHNTFSDRQNDISRTGNELVPLLVARGESELAIAVQAVADAAKDGNPTHIVTTRRDVKARLRVLAATPAGTKPADEREGGILPALLSASDIARHINHKPKSVGSFLIRYAKKYPDCRQETDGRRRNEPGYLYRTADVWPALEQWMRGKPAT